MKRTGNIAVIGAGLIGHAAAIAFRRALPDARVVLHGAAQAAEYPGAATAEIHRFHRLVGLEEAMFRRRCSAVPVSEGEWALDGAAFTLVPLGNVPFADGAALHQLWLRWTRDGGEEPRDWAQVARRAAGGQPPEERFSAEAYLALLAEMARHLGVERDGGDGPQGQADLVVDTRGVGGWAILDEPGGVERVAVSSGSTRWETPVWSARSSPQPRRERRGWHGNLLHLGRAALQCESFDGHPLSAALQDITRAIELLPRPDSAGREQAEYSRRTGLIHDFLCDWAAERAGLPPQVGSSHAALRQQFAHRGRIPFRDEDPVGQGAWIGQLLGRGVRPANGDPVSESVSQAQIHALFGVFR